MLYSGEEDRADFELPIGQISVRVRSSPRRSRENEDAAAVIPIGDDGIVLAVADGVGGAPGGRDAARAVLSSAADAITKNGAATVQPAIVGALERANAELLSGGLGSAATFAAAAIMADSVHTYHVGDSEILIVGQRGKVEHRIVPHSPTGFAVQAGILNQDDALHHDFRHILLNVVGTEHMKIEIEGAIALKQRDTVLVATDGVLDNLYLGEIIEVIRCGALSSSADALIEQASARMTGWDAKLPSKPDDIAVVMFRPHVGRRLTE